jgi:hypothetical protein
MKNLIAAATAAAFLLCSAAALAAEAASADVGIPDVREAPDVQGPADVGTGGGSSGTAAAAGVVTSREPLFPAIRLPAAKAASASTAKRAIPATSFGAGVAVRFPSEAPAAAEATFLDLYLELYPLVFQEVLGVGFTLTCDVVPVADGDLVIGTQADVRWVYLNTAGFNSWLDFRVGPAYEMTANSLRLYAYFDVGFDLDLGGTLLETRIGGFLTGTTGGMSVSAGMQL